MTLYYIELVFTGTKSSFKDTEFLGANQKAFALFKTFCVFYNLAAKYNDDFMDFHPSCPWAL